MSREVYSELTRLHRHNTAAPQDTNMVAKLKTKPKVIKRSAPVALPSSKRKKSVQKNKHTGRASDDGLDSSEDTFKGQEPSSGDEFQGRSFEEKLQGISERSSDGEDGDSDHEAEDADHCFRAPNSTGQGVFDSDFDSDDHMNEEQHDAQDLSYAVRDEELEALDREYKELQAQEVDMLRNLKGRSDEEVLKGQAVRCQKALWDKALEVRILLQKPFSSANCLPLGDFKMQMCKSSKEVEGAFAKLNATSVNTLHCLHQTLKVLLSQADSTSKASDHTGAEDLEDLDDLDAVWQRLSASYARFVPFRNSSVDRWQRKTQLSSGAAASKSKLRAFNQSVSQQIENHMRDFSRLLQRMCLRRSSVNVIGMPAGQAEDPIPNENTLGFTEGNKDFNGDLELIDDTEFYQELLREFLESSDPSSLGAMYPIKRMRIKNRKIVDRRASKGRKIRYNVHDKIVNFMVPIPKNMPAMAEKLFSAGIFQGGSMQPLKL